MGQASLQCRVHAGRAPGWYLDIQSCRENLYRHSVISCLSKNQLGVFH